MIGIYCRISKQKDVGKDVSIPVQKNQGIEFAKSLGMNYKIYVDEGISGGGDDISKRPEFALMLNAIKKQEISIVYCYDQSRIERNNRTWNMFLALMLERQCKYYPGGKFLDLDVPENKFFTGMISLANELYAALTGIKVKAAIAENARKGKTHGLAAYGYEKGEDGHFKLNEAESEVVRRIFKMSLDGLGTYSIAKILNSENIPTKFNQFDGEIKRKDKYTKALTSYSKTDVKWRGNVIHDIIKNTIYKGIRKWNDENVPIPAIFDEDYWQQVNDNLENNKKKVGKREEYQYLLNGIIFCEHCGHEYRGKKRLKGNDNAYKCKGKSKHGITCESRGISLPKIETFIIHHLFISKELEKFLTGLSEEKGELDNLKAKLNKLRKEYERNLLIEKKAYDLLFDPDFAEDSTFKDRLKAIKTKINEQVKSIDLIENKLIAEKSSSRVSRVKNVIGEYKLTSDFTTTKRLIHSLIKTIKIRHEINYELKKGYFYVTIEYRGFDEVSLFMTDWQALKWYWLSHYRARASGDEELSDDKELFKFLTKSDAPADFSGFTTLGSGLIIELNKKELITFD